MVCQIIVIKTTKCQITERTKKFIIHDLYLNQKSNPNLSVRYNRNKFTLKHVQYKLIKKTEKDETILKMNFFFWPNIYFSIKKFFSNRRTFKLYTDQPNDFHILICFHSLGMHLAVVIFLLFTLNHLACIWLSFFKRAHTLSFIHCILLTLQVNNTVQNYFILRMADTIEKFIRIEL